MLRSLNSIAATAVVAIDTNDFDGQAICCAYIYKGTDVRSLKSRLSEILSEYRILIYWRDLPKLPKNKNGKIDKNKIVGELQNKMNLRSLKDSDVKTIIKWFQNEENYKWLDFGKGIQKLEEPTIKFMVQREIHAMRLFTPDDSEKPIGIVALSDINKKFKTAVLWYLLGDKEYSGKNYTTRAVTEILNYGFNKLKLQSIYAWAIDKNKASIKVLEKHNFKLIGKRRQCHYIDSESCDRLYYDLIVDEHLNGSQHDELQHQASIEHNKAFQESV